MRAAPDPMAREIGAIPPAACGIAIFGPCRGWWCPVFWRGRSGWSNAAYLERGGLFDMLMTPQLRSPPPLPPPVSASPAPPRLAPSRPATSRPTKAAAGSRPPVVRAAARPKPPPRLQREAVARPRVKPGRTTVASAFPRTQRPEPQRTEPLIAPAPVRATKPPAPTPALPPAPPAEASPPPATPPAVPAAAPSMPTFVPPAAAMPAPPPTSPTAQEGPREVCVIEIPKGDTLKVRAGPGNDQSLRFGYPAGVCGVRITGPCSNGWCPVDYRGYRGWAEQRFLK